MKRAVLRFRVDVGNGYHVRVCVYDTVREMHAAAKKFIGVPSHPDEKANTITSTDSPGGCVAVVLFTWKFAPPHIIAHEATHCGVECVTKIGPGLSKDEDEPLASYVELIFRAIMRRIHS